MTPAGGLDTWGAWVSIADTGYLTIAGASKGIIVEVRHDELDDGECDNCYWTEIYQDQDVDEQ